MFFTDFAYSCWHEGVVLDQQTCIIVLFNKKVGLSGFEVIWASENLLCQYEAGAIEQGDPRVFQYQKSDPGGLFYSVCNDTLLLL